MSHVSQRREQKVSSEEGISLKGILFKPWKAKAISESSPDREWQTRRLDHLKEINQEPDKWRYCKVANIPSGFLFENNGQFKTIQPHYQVGETVYIKEAIHRFNVEYASYDLDFTPVMFLQSANRFHWRWTRDKLSPMFLPHEAARYFIKITDVRAERLQGITEEDAIAEGLKNTVLSDMQPYFNIAIIPASQNFKKLWDSINKDYKWESNPFVFVYTFRLAVFSRRKEKGVKIRW